MEAFFQECSKLDEIEIKELLLRKYHNINYIMSMEAVEFITFLEKALCIDTEDKLFQMWLQRFTLMDKDTYISFKDFRSNAMGENIDKRSTTEILEEIEEVEALFERR
jgi:hypothetical protein